MASPQGPTIAVIIPAFNAARYLGEALESLVRQTYRASEIMVVDDGSTDGTAQVLDEYRDSVVAIRQENAGDGAARNAGLLRTTAQYVAFLDADDVCAPERLERQVALLQQNPDAVACFSGHWTFDSSGRLAEYPVSSPPADADSLDFLARCQFVSASVMFDRLRARGARFPEDVRSAGGDIIFTAQLATRGRVIAVPDSLYGYRSHPAQKSIKNRATSNSNRYFEYRYQWANAHWHEHWPDRGWPEVERKLWQGLIDQTEAAYWARQKQFFLNDQNYLRRNWPSHLAPPSVLQWRWYPEWLWQAKSHLDGWIRSKS